MGWLIMFITLITESAKTQTVVCGCVDLKRSGCKVAIKSMASACVNILFRECIKKYEYRSKLASTVRKFYLLAEYELLASDEP